MTSLGALLALGLSTLATVALAQTQAAPNDPPPPAPNQSPKDTVPPATDSSAPTRAGKQEPSSKVTGTTTGPILADGVLTAPGAPVDGHTAPAKYSKKNDARDKLPIAAYALLHLTEDEKREIALKLPQPKGQASGQATIGAIVPTEVGDQVESVPDELASRFPSLKGMVFSKAADAILIINPRHHHVIAVLK